MKNIKNYLDNDPSFQICFTEDDGLYFDTYDDQANGYFCNLSQKQSMSKVITRNNKKIDSYAKSWNRPKINDSHPAYYMHQLTKNSLGKSYDELYQKFIKRYPKFNDRLYFYSRFNNCNLNKHSKYCKYILINGIVSINKNYYHYNYKKPPKHLYVDGEFIYFNLSRHSKEWKKIHSEYLDKQKKESRKYFKYSFYPDVELDKRKKEANKQKQKRNEKPNI